MRSSRRTAWGAFVAFRPLAVLALVGGMLGVTSPAGAALGQYGDSNSANQHRKIVSIG